MAKNTYTRSCLYCQNEFISSDKYKKYCNLSCSNKHRSVTRQTQKRNEEYYNEHPKHCGHCFKELEYNKRLNKFCSLSCAASFNNTGRISPLRKYLTDAERGLASNLRRKARAKNKVLMSRIMS